MASIAYIYGKCPASHPHTADKDGFWPVHILRIGGTAHLPEKQPCCYSRSLRTHFGRYCDCVIFGKLEPAQFMLVCMTHCLLICFDYTDKKTPQK